jgi:hypothetical protein
VAFIVYIVTLSIFVGLIASQSSLTSKPIKLIAILLLIHGYLITFGTFKEVSGYPTTSDMPEEFEIIWGRVVETETNKFIELWIQQEHQVLDKLSRKFSLAFKLNNISRVYRLKYSKKNHKTILVLQDKINSGDRVGIKRSDNSEGSEIDLDEGLENFSIEFESRKIEK